MLHKSLRPPTATIKDATLQFNTRSLGRLARKSLDLAHHCKSEPSVTSIVATRGAINAKVQLEAALCTFTKSLTQAKNCINGHKYGDSESEIVKAVESLVAMQSALEIVDPSGDYALDNVDAIINESIALFESDKAFAHKKTLQSIQKCTSATADLLASGKELDFDALVDAGATTPWADLRLERCAGSTITQLKTGYVDQILNSADASAMLAMAHAEDRQQESKKQAKQAAREHERKRDEAVTSQIKELLAEVRDER